MERRGRPKRVFTGWKIVWGGAAIQAVHSGLVFNAFSLIAAQIHAEFGWSKSTLGGAFAMNRAESGLLGPLQGWMTDRWGPRAVLRLGAVIMAAGLVGFATLDSITEFYAFYLVIALGSSLAGYLPVTVAIVNWFQRKRSRALAWSQMGFAVGGTLAFLYGVLLDQVGWRQASPPWALAKGIASASSWLTYLSLYCFVWHSINLAPSGCRSAPITKASGCRMRLSAVAPSHW